MAEDFTTVNECHSTDRQAGYLGLECGSTRSIVVLSDEHGDCVSRFELGPANFRLISQPQMETLFRRVAAQVPRPAAVGIGMAGVISESERQVVRIRAELAWPGVPCWAGNDLEIALAVADVHCSDNTARVVVISGTGASCYGRNASGRTAFVGGWGHLLGDRGSAYDIALGALKAVLQDFDKTGKWPALGTQCLRTLQLASPNELVTWVQEANKAEIASIAKEVFTSAAGGSPLAKRILEEAAQSLARAAVMCARRLVRQNRPVQVFLAGSVLRRQPRFAHKVSARIRTLLPGARVAFLEPEAAWGAVEMAKKLATGGKPKETALRCHTCRNIRHCEHPIPKSQGLSPTEQRNPRSDHLEKLPIAAAIGLILEEDARIPAALLCESAKIQKGIRLILRAFRRGGRLFYVGAGTSGRLAALDASECPPTFSVSADGSNSLSRAGGRRYGHRSKAQRTMRRQGPMGFAFEG